MRLSHKSKVAHKRSGAAKGWAQVVRARHVSCETIMAAALDAAARVAANRPCERPALPVDADKPKPSLVARGVSLVKGALSRLKAAGEAQRNLLQGRR